MKTEPTSTRLEIILDREFEIGSSTVWVSGISSPGAMAWVMAQSHSKQFNKLPHLVVTPSLKEALQLQGALEAFDSTCQSIVLPPFDVSPYSGLYCSPGLLADRSAFLNQALFAKPGQIFIAPLTALLQRTMPAMDFELHSDDWKRGTELPETWIEDLTTLGYMQAPYVEDRGQFAVRGGLIDIWSPASASPVRIELFGDQIETLRTFDPATQQSRDEIQSVRVIPSRESIYLEDQFEKFIQRMREDFAKRGVSGNDADELLRSCVQKNHFSGLEFLTPFLYAQFANGFDYFKGPLSVWFLDHESIARSWDDLERELKAEEAATKTNPVHPPFERSYSLPKDLKPSPGSREIQLSLLESDAEGPGDVRKVDYRVATVREFSNSLLALPFASESWASLLKNRLGKWRSDGYRVFVSIKPGPPAERLVQALEKADFVVERPQTESLLWDTWIQAQSAQPELIHFFHGTIPESWRAEEELVIFLREDDFFGHRERRTRSSAADDFQSRARRLSFGDLKPGDLVVHTKHGVGQYEGLKIMAINGVDNEFIQVAYKDKDKLYLPVYRVGQLQKYSGAATTSVLDKLGGTSWEKTKSKVKGHLRDIASELLALYAKRAEMHRPPLAFDTEQIFRFEQSFPFEETEDQLRAISDIRHDLASTKPMDRLICGDVGFGKTEVAMRAAFLAVQGGKQVAVLAPTTVLTFQHVETFKKRFQGWPFEIRVLNRFVSTADAKKTLADLKEGKIDILIGTHKLFGKDVVFKDLGLLIVDEEQKFGVAHKEKIRKMRAQVDTLTLSATPIPRTLNMSLVGVRDLSLINSAPVDRLPTRTFICKWEPETLRKAIMSEIGRGGQVYFIHNRIQSIYQLVDEIRQIVPEARIRVGHGQMPEEELEQTMMAFFNHEIDVLVCTAIVESGMDVPRANTMFIDRADLFGLSQLYQLRGRVGRSKLRAYCYLILPKDRKLDRDAQERLRVIQENTALGSGIRIAQYDLELRGSGTILGEEQSGHIDSVGYELYMDLLKEALSEAQGLPAEDTELDPEINLRIPALIPDDYIQDVRIRLGYYKALADIKSESDLEKIADELRDQFGPIPDPAMNLMGLMLIRRLCKDLGIRDVGAGTKSVSLVFTERTPLKPEQAIKLAMRENKKYSITPDSRLNIRMNNITWTAVYEELNLLLKSI